MPRKKQIPTIPDDVKQEIFEYFREWNPDDYDSAGTFLDAVLDKVAETASKQEKKAEKLSRENKALLKRLEDANYDVSFPPLSENALRKLLQNDVKIVVFRLHPENRKLVQRFVTNNQEDFFWETASKQFWYSMDMEEPKNEYVATEILKNWEEKERQIIFLRSPKEKY